MTGTAPDGYGAALGMSKAISDARINALDINYINTYATSTPLGDLNELIAIKKAFNDLPVTISAAKSMTGHLLGPGGTIESIICVLVVKKTILLLQRSILKL